MPSSQPSQRLVRCCESPHIKSWPTVYPCDRIMLLSASYNVFRGFLSDGVLVQRFVLLEYTLRFLCGHVCAIFLQYSSMQRAGFNYKLEMELLYRNHAHSIYTECINLAIHVVT